MCPAITHLDGIASEALQESVCFTERPLNQTFETSALATRAQSDDVFSSQYEVLLAFDQWTFLKKPFPDTTPVALGRSLQAGHLLGFQQHAVCKLSDRAAHVLGLVLLTILKQLFLEIYQYLFSGPQRR